MERLDAEFHFDAVCAVCAPYRTAFALETAQIGGKKLLWQLDPYASNKDYTAPGGLRAGRAVAGNALIQTFITPQALPDYDGRAAFLLARKGAGAGLPGFTAGRAGACARGGAVRISAAVCTPRYGSRILRWNCLPR